MYYFLYGFLYLVSLIPMRILYIISDGVYLLVYYVLGYRKKIVLDNLEIAFPEKTNAERLIIAKRFYRNLFDSFIETVKLLSASSSFLEKRVTANWDAFLPLYDSGRSCQVHLGHTFNWEWGQHVLNAKTRYDVFIVYMPVNNAIFEKLMYRMRTRSGTNFVPASEFKKIRATFAGSQSLLALVADQSPGIPANAYWRNFFGRPTGFVAGPEKGARHRNIPVVFASIIKPRRGHYHANIKVACEVPRALEEGELTSMYVDYLEREIRKNPEMWLWSHRRWKHGWKPEYKHWIGNEPPPSNLS